MEPEKFIPEQHQKGRLWFRILGPLLLITAVVCIIVAFIEFLTLQGFEEPKLFWLFFAALPIVFIGFILTGLGFGSSFAKYQSREYAPIAKDTFHYLAKESTTGLKEISNALQQGTTAEKRSFNCHNCHQPNPVLARFCNHCGEKLMLICPGCQHENNQDAHFCNHCGISLGIKTD
jgi:hypothetical protein